MNDDLSFYYMLPQIICRYTTFLSGITKSSKKKNNLKFVT